MKKIILALVTMTIFAAAAFAGNSMDYCDPKGKCFTITVTEGEKSYKGTRSYSVSTDLVAKPVRLRLKYKKLIEKAGAYAGIHHTLSRNAGEEYADILILKSRFSLAILGTHPVYTVGMIIGKVKNKKKHIAVQFTPAQVTEFLALLDAVDNS